MKYNVKSCELYRTFQSEKIGKQWWFDAKADVTNTEGETREFEFSFWFDAEDLCEHTESEECNEDDWECMAEDMLFCSCETLFSAKSFSEIATACENSLYKMYH